MPPDDTHVSLRDYYDTRWSDHASQHRAEEDARAAALVAQGKLVDAAFASSQAAIDKAEGSQKQTDAKNNDFRGQLSDQAKGFATREQVERLDTEMDRRLGEVVKDIAELKNANARQQGALAVARFVGFGGLLAGLSALVYAVVNGGAVLK